MEKILLATGSKANSELIMDFLKHNYDVYRYHNDIEIAPRFDLIIADGKMLNVLKEKYPNLKSNTDALFLPIMLITSKKGVGLITSQIWRIVDEVVTTPISKMELFASVEVLLRARRQSLKLCELGGKLEEENSRLIRESNLLIDYFTNVSHELRTPLSIILSSIDFLSACFAEEMITPETLKNTLNISKRNCHRLLRVINNLLDLSKIDAGYMGLKLQDVDPAQVIKSIIDSVQDYAKKKNITLNFLSDTRCSQIAVDEDMLDRVLLNLLSNAIKFTPQDGVVTVLLQDSRNRGHIVITVKDNGIGIPAEKQRAIFDRFVQADNTMSKRSEGCGLGLSLAKSLVELHGGRLWMESKVGIGSKFCFDIPVKTVGSDTERSLAPDIRDQVFYEFSDL